MYIDILYNFIYFYEFHNILRFSIFYIIFWCNYVLYLLDVFVFSCPLTCNSFWIWPFCTGPGFDFAQWITIYLMILIVICHSFVMFLHYTYGLSSFPVWLKSLVKSLVIFTQEHTDGFCYLYDWKTWWNLLNVYLGDYRSNFFLSMTI